MTAKDLALGIIGQIGTDGATGHVIEYTGEAVRGLSMEGRMTLCNMSIEAGARAGMIAPDETTFAYVKNRRFAPHGKNWDGAVANWRTLTSDEGAKYDTVIEIDAAQTRAVCHLGDESRHGGRGDGPSSRTRQFPQDSDRRAAEQALRYMGLEPGTPVERIAVDRVFIGSCTNSRLEDLRAAAKVAKGISRESEGARDGRARIAGRQARGGSRKASTEFFRKQALNGASQDARCVWA